MQDRFLILLSMFVSVSPTAQAAILSEWPLPAGSPLQIDSSSPSHRVYFVDQALGTINELDPAVSTLTSWPAPFSPTVPGGIVIDALVMPNFVYVTDLPGNTLGQLDLTNNIYLQFNLAMLPWTITGGPRQLVYDSTHILEPGDVVWFSASGTAGTQPNPLIGYFAPAAFKFRVWKLPASIALPGEAIDGLAFNLTHGVPSVYFTVNGAFNNNVAVLLPLANLVNFWPLPPTYIQPVPIVATTAGDVFRVQCPGCNTVARISTASNLLDEWVSAEATDAFMTLDPGSLSPRFTALSGATPTADLLVTACPKMSTPLSPDMDYAEPDLDYLFPDAIPLQPTIIGVAPITNALNLSAACPFFGMQPISSGGPLSTDLAGGTWVSETAALAIATF